MDSLKLSSEQAFDRYLTAISAIWNDIGLPDCERSSRLQNVNQQIADILTASIEKEKLFQHNLEDQLDHDTTKLRGIEFELGMEPYEPLEGHNIIELTHTLQSHIEALLLLKKERHVRYLTVTRDLLLNVGKPDLSRIEEAVLVLDESVTSCDLKQCHDELLVQLTSNRKVVTDLRQKLTALFDILNIPADERTAQWSLLDSDNTATFSTIEQLRHTIGEYERLKEQRLSSMINAAKKELCGLWDVCGFDELRRSQQCESYFTDEDNDSLLNDLLSAIRLMNKYHEDTSRITSRVDKRQKAFCDLMEVERRWSDPERLMNRGGCLLKDEQERKRLMIEVKKLEREICQLITAFEISSELSYFYNGQSFDAFMAEQWLEFNCLKEKDKESRLMKKSQQLEEDLRYGTKSVPTGKKRFAGFTTNKQSNDANRLKVSHNVHAGSSSYVPAASLGCAIMSREPMD